MGSARENFVGVAGIISRRSGRISALSILVLLTLYLSIHYVPTRLYSKSRQSLGSTAALEEIPPRVWQIFFGYTPINDFLPFIQSWVTKNQDYAYTLMSNDGGNAFARKHYADRPEILKAFLDLQFPVLRSDLLRYMILETEGGVYSDLDTNALKSVRDWIPEDMKSKVHLVVGIEYDQLGGQPEFGMTEQMQFCQWTMAASKGHPILKKVVEDVVHALQAMATRKNTTISELKPEDEEVVDVSGPVIWTRTVMHSMSEMTGTHIDYRNMTGMTEPRLFGDVLVLPIDGFGTGQPHSNSGKDGAGNAYIRHMWKGSWKHNWG